MAGAYTAPQWLIVPFTPTKNSTLISKKPLFVSCSVITPRPRKLTRRKNYLRKKILRTLTTEPHTETLVETIQSPLENPIQQNDGFSSAGDELMLPENQEMSPENLEMLPENQELLLEVAEPAGVVNATAGIFSKSSLVKYGLWVVGAFVFQTICAVWVFGSADNSGNNGSSDRNGNGFLELDLNGKSKHKIRMFVNGDGKQGIGNGGIVYVDEAEMEKKINEIKQMAREAREKERLQSKGSNLDEEHEDDVEDSDAEVGIKQEVNERLIRVRKGLDKVSNKQHSNSVTHPRVDVERKDRNDGGNSAEKDLNAALTFKRKNKFRDFSSKPVNKPKGFMAPGHQYNGTNGKKTLKGINEVSNEDGKVGVDVSSNSEADLVNLDSYRGSFMNVSESIERKEINDGTESVTPIWMKKSSENSAKQSKGRNVKKVNLVETVKNSSLEKSGRKKKGIASNFQESDPGIDISVSRNYGSRMVDAVDSTGSSIQETPVISNNGNPLVEVVDSREPGGVESTISMERRKNSDRNEISRRKDVKDQKMVKPNGVMESSNDTDFWWFGLPYVLAIRMWRGNEDEGPEGLFALKSSSQVNGRLSHTVAFEDCGDATNFCYLLQSFFEDLEDFNAEVVPLPAKELREAIRLQSMKVIVVKKGKLKLYAGQPLVEAETALRSLIEQE